MEEINIFSRIQFVGRGTKTMQIQKLKHNREELKKIITEMKLKEAEYNNRPNREQRTSQQSDSEEDDDVENRYDLDRYDEEVENENTMEIETLILNNPPESNSEDSDAEEDEFVVKPSDNLILAAHITGNVSMLEAYVFNHENAEFFLLHDIYLPSFPLALQYLDFSKTDAENRNPTSLAAVGYVSNEIDVWDLTVTGSLEPKMSLSNKKCGSGKRHKQAVMDLSWNSKNKHILASSSADKTVRLWDLNNGESFLKLGMFEEKVQSIDFHQNEAQNLLAGDCAGNVKLFDCRSPSTFKTWIFEKEIEKVSWSKSDPFHYFASTDLGSLHYVDIRNNIPVWNLKAHDKGITGFAHSFDCPDMMVTVSMDETVKVWDLKDHNPQLVTQKDVNIGEIYSIDSCPEVPYVFCIGGKHKDNPMYLWDSRENEAVVQQFHNRMGIDFVKFSELKLKQEEPGPSHRPTGSTSNQQRIKLRKNPRRPPRGFQESGSTPVPGTSSERQRQRNRDRKKMHPKVKKEK